MPTKRLVGIFFCLNIIVKFYNDTLSPKFYIKDKMIPALRKKLVDITNNFLDDVNIKLPKIDDIQLTGSLANFNYTPKSDLDVHVLLDFKKIDEDTDLVKAALDGIRFIWNTKHDIKIKGHDVELYFQDTKEPHVSTGLYSLKDGDWVKKPKYNPPTINDDDVKKKFEDFKFVIDKLEELTKKISDPNKSKALYEYGRRVFQKIKKMRQEGLKGVGEFSVGNLTFKYLRNTEYIDKLHTLINQNYDDIYSESFFNPGKVNHRQQHAVVRDPGMRKHASTVPDYLKVSELPNCFKVMQKPAGPKFIYISPQDAYKLSKHFGVRDLRRPKGLKKSGVAIGIKPNGRHYLMRTNKNKRSYLR